MSLRYTLRLVAAAALLGVTPLTAQQSRPELIQDARNEFDMQAYDANLATTGDPPDASVSTTSSSRSRLTAWPAPPAPVALGVSVPAEALGAPVVDRGGSPLGVVVGPDRLVSVAGAQELLDEALGEPVADEQAIAGGGGFPFVWVGAGAVVVGAAILLFGGGDDEAPATGGISVTFPGSGP